MHITNRNSYVRVSVSLGGKKNKLLEQFNVTMEGGRIFFCNENSRIFISSRS